MINFDDLDAAIDHCRMEDLAPYEQTHWGRLAAADDRCVTGACLAGTYVLMKGYHFVDGGEGYGIYYCEDKEGRHFNISRLAREELGLTERQAEELFFYENDLEIIEHMVKHLRDHPDAFSHELYEIREAIQEERLNRPTHFSSLEPL